MATADYAGFRRVQFSVCVHSPMKEAETLMVQLGFRKVEYNVVYEGPVAKLVEGLRQLGWEKEPHQDNPYLLGHPNCCMTFNYAESETVPSERFISYFRGVP